MFTNGNQRRTVLLAYLAMLGFYLVAITILMFLGRIQEQTYLAQVALVINGIGALLIRFEAKTEPEVEIAKADVTVETKSAGRRSKAT